MAFTLPAASRFHYGSATSVGGANSVPRQEEPAPFGPGLALDMVAHQAAGGLIGTGGNLRAKGDAWPPVGRAGAAEVGRMIVEGAGMKTRRTKGLSARRSLRRPLLLKERRLYASTMRIPGIALELLRGMGLIAHP